MSSRDNLKQLMKKQQLLFDAMETKPPQINRDRRYDIKKNDSQQASSKLLNNSGFSQKNIDNSNSNIQTSFQNRNSDKSNDKINISQNKIVEQIRPIDQLKKNQQQKINPDLYNQFLQSRNLQKDEANKVQKFINDVFSSSSKGQTIKTQIASRNSASNSPYRQEIKLQTGLSPQNGHSPVSRLYNQIHCKIDNRAKIGIKQIEENQFPQISSKNTQHKLIEKYLSINPKQRHEFQQDQLQQRKVNPINTMNPIQEPNVNELRPRTEGYQQKIIQEKNELFKPTIDIKTNNEKIFAINNDKESSLSTTTNNESKTDCEKIPKIASQKNDKGQKNINMNIINPQIMTKVSSELPIEKIICQEECIFTILAVITRQTKVTKLCKNYLTLLSETNLVPIQILYPEPDQIKILERSFLFERISIMVILIESLGSQEDFEDNTQNIKNLLLYCHHNQILLLDSLNGKFQNQERQKTLLEARLKQLQNNKQKIKLKNNTDKVILMKKNNNVIFSILTLIIENPSKDNYLDLDKLLSGHQQLSLAQGTKILMSCFQKMLQHINQLRLSSDTQLTEKTFDVDFENSEKCSEDDEVRVPYLPKRIEKTYTLVLDLDETLVHYQELSDGGQFLVRPYAEQFLQELSKYYEIVIFTAALQDYADFILDIIDNNHVISHRLYRQHTTTNAGICVKDLIRLGRDLNNTLIVDNLPENFSCQPDNGIYVQSWFGEPEDRALFELAPLLKCKFFNMREEIVKKKVGDVRVALRKFRDKMIDNISKGIQDPHLNLSLD